MRSIDEMVKQLPPAIRTEVFDFVEFLLTKHRKKDHPHMTFDWAGGLADLRAEYTAVELQHKASEWRTEDEVSS